MAPKRGHSSRSTGLGRVLMAISRVRTRSHRPALALAGVASLLTGSACALGSGQCTKTTITAPPIRVSDRLAPLTFTATLLAKDRPVVGADLIFLVHVVSSTGDSTFSIGKATTGPDGVARYPRKAGTDGIVRTTERVPNYVVQYRSFAKVDGVQYCSSEASASFTIT